MPDTSTGKVGAYLAEVRERSERLVTNAGSLPITHPGVRGLLESAGDVPPLLASLKAVLGDHGDCAVYLGAEECGHPEPPWRIGPRTPWDDWDDDHPHGLGDVGRICLLTETGRYCPACTHLVYEDDPVGDQYDVAATTIPAPCADRIREAISRKLLGEGGDGE